MSDHHHPSEETLLAHASGGLDEAHRVVIATHLAGCPACRQSVRRAERLGGTMLAALPAAEMSKGALEAALARLDEPVPALPPPPPLPAGLPASLAAYRIGRWRRPAPGLGLITILPPTAQRAGLHLLRVAPGMAMPAHGHSGLELTAVLSGAFADDDGIFHAGDVSECTEDAHHTPIAHGAEPCICLTAVAGRLRFDHWLARLVQPLFGI